MKKNTHGSSEHDQSFYVGFRTKGKRPLKWILFSRPMFPQPRGMLLDQGIFGDVSQGYADALGEAFENFALWRRAHKIQSSQKRFTPGQILRDGYGFFLNAKGFNARLIAEWLLDLIIAIPTGDPRHGLVEVALKLEQNTKWVKGIRNILNFHRPPLVED